MGCVGFRRGQSGYRIAEARGRSDRRRKGSGRVRRADRRGRSPTSRFKWGAKPRCSARPRWRLYKGRGEAQSLGHIEISPQAQSSRAPGVSLRPSSLRSSRLRSSSAAHNAIASNIRTASERDGWPGSWLRHSSIACCHSEFGLDRRRPSWVSTRRPQWTPPCERAFGQAMPPSKSSYISSIYAGQPSDFGCP